ncbi:hypothetical protein HNR32_002460 [Pectinatus brassicae]|uniref:Uncharacterized protein n=2 Tax=Pectinatus brassicae TaxID=862415 RepID=A0A840UM69_9FIRM|nr:hypothetical protein [Pectinatus brassicae]MBB5337300.1 hypothetical protein [Pectinatus brassicae]
MSTKLSSLQPPPAQSTPPLMPPPNAMMSNESQSADNLMATVIIDNKKANIADKTIEYSNSDENVLLVRNNGNLTIDNSKLIKTGDSSNNEDSNFTGLNAILLANNSHVSISNSTLDSSAEGSNGIFATGKKSLITVSNVIINTEKGSSRGLDATYGGNIIADNVKITTKGAHCAALATDRGEGNVSVTQGTLSTSGEGSPCIYSTGNIKATNSTGIATGSEIAVVEGKNSITLENVDLTGYVQHGIMLYQSFSGDANTGTASFSVKNSKLHNNSQGAMFYITNTKAIANLENTLLDSKSNILINVTSDRWGNSGQNGGDFTFNAKNQLLKGNVLANSLSRITINLKNKTIWQGAFNPDNTADKAAITLDFSSQWELTGNSYITSFTDNDLSFNNIKSHGYNVYYNLDSCKNLAGKTYLLNGGGKLAPIQSN